MVLFLGLRRKYSDKVLKCSNVCKGKAREDHKIDPQSQKDIYFKIEINIELQTADKLARKQRKKKGSQSVRK